MSEKKSTCPKCKKERSRSKARMKLKADKAYGVAEADEYVRLRTESEKYVSMKDSLRQDYGFCLDTDAGALCVDFNCGCDVCGFTYKYHKKINVLS